MEKTINDESSENQKPQNTETVSETNNNNQTVQNNPIKQTSQSSAEQKQNEQIQSIQNKLNQLAIEPATDIKDQQSQQIQNEQESQQTQDYYTRDFIEINRSTVNFNKGTLFPGSVQEVEVIVSLKEDTFAQIPKQNLPIKIVATCNQAKFNDLDEYVFSVRDNDRFQYFEEVTPILNRNNRVSVKVAVKIPAVKQPQVIEGSLSIQLFNVIPFFLQMTAKCQIPQIVCLKQLYKTQQDVRMIKIPAKKNMRIPPLPFKNISSFNFLLQAQTASSYDFSNRAYDVIVSSVVNCNANTPFFVNMQLRPNINYKGVVPVTDIIRKVLILKVKNSSVCFSYPIQVLVYESNGGSSVS